MIQPCRNLGADLVRMRLTEAGVAMVAEPDLTNAADVSQSQPMGSCDRVRSRYDADFEDDLMPKILPSPERIVSCQIPSR